MGDDAIDADVVDGGATGFDHPLDAKCLTSLPETDAILEYRYHFEKGADSTVYYKLTVSK